MKKWVFISAILSLLTSASVMSEDALPPPPETEKYDRTFPIWAQEALDLGYKLPKAYGLSLSYMNMDQPLVVDSVDFTNLLIGGNDVSGVVAIDASDADQESETVTLRGDVWILPFWNVYGIFGYTEGSSTATVDVRLFPNFEENFPGLADRFPELVDGLTANDIKFPLDFEGLTYGAGTTLVGGIDHWFAMLDVNYTYTNLDILDGKISAIVVSPRVGYMTEYKKHAIQVWVGSMYQNVEQEFGGSLSDIGFKGIAVLEDGKFNVDQHLASKWNSLVGGQIGITPSIDLLFEGGFGTRKSYMVSLGYRY